MATSAEFLARNAVDCLPDGVDPRGISMEEVNRSLAGSAIPEDAEAIRLEDSLSSQLQGYGVVHQSVPARLDPVIQAMAHTLNQLAATLHHQSRAMRAQ